LLPSRCSGRPYAEDAHRRDGVNNIIYLVGLIVVIIAVLSFFGLR
jgi:hypothetical protein